MNNLCFMTNLSSSEWAAWVQAIGSIGAILATIFVLQRQNKHALHLLEETQRREIHRRTAAVAAIVDRAAGELAIVCKKIEEDGQARTAIRILNARSFLGETMRVMSVIPLYELGSYDLVDGVQQLLATLGDTILMIDNFANMPDDQFQPDVAGNGARLHAASALQAHKKIKSAIADLKKSVI